MLKVKKILMVAAIGLAAPSASAQMPGAADMSRVTAGTYMADSNHTQVIWTLNHLGISPLSGAFGAASGTLDLDPANAAADKVSVTFNTADLTVTSPMFAKHLASPEFFDVAKYPTASFTSTSVRVSGDSATIMGNLTIKGITKPVILQAKFYGAGASPMTKKLNIGFTAKTMIKRSDFGLGFFAPMVADDVELTIQADFTA